MDVYVDILFLINSGMDALCLILTARLLHRPLSMGRLLMSSVIGGVYGVAALFMEVGTLTAFALDVCICVLMCLISMGIRRLWLTSGLYVLTSMVMGGMMTALYHWLNRAGAAELLPGGEEGVSSVAFLLLAVAGGLFTLLWGKIFRRAEARRAAHVTVTATLAGKTVTFSGMIDSGNLLTDPVSGTPVIAVDRKQMTPILSEQLSALLDISPLPLSELTDVPEGERIRLIPTQTATGDGMLVALRPDEVVLDAGNGRPLSVKVLVCPVPLEDAPAKAMIPSGLFV